MSPQKGLYDHIMTSNKARFSLAANPQPKRPRGLYLAVIHDMDLDKSRHGVPMVRFIMELVGNGSTRRYLWRCPVSDDSIHKLSQVYKALGRKCPSKVRILNGGEVIDPEEFIGREVLVYLKPEMYQGKWRSVITEVRPISQADSFMTTIRDEDKEETL